MDQRTLLGSASVAAISVAEVTALLLNPGELVVWLAVCGFAAVATAISSVVADPRELLVSLLFGAAPVMSLAADGSPNLMIAPLAALLLLGAELNAWSWEVGRGSPQPGARSRATHIGQLAAGALLASTLVALTARWTLLSGHLATIAAAIAIAGLAWIAFPSADRPGQVNGELSHGHSDSTP